MVVYRGFDTDKDIPDLSGKVIVLTGGTGGVGKTAVQHLAKHNPARIFFTGRNQASADDVIASCPDPSRVTFVTADLTSLASVKAAAEKITAETDRLDVLVTNAGIMAVPPGLTKDGYEIQFGTNHVGNAALALHLLPLMARTAETPGSDVRHIAVTSLGYRGASAIDFDTIKTTQENMSLATWGRYGQSKLANILFARELARRYPRITSCAIHPGVVETALVTDLTFWQRMFVRMTNLRMMTPDQGGVNTVWAATSKDVKEKLAKRNPALFEPVGEVHQGSKAAHNEELGKKLWEWTEEEVGVKAP